ncbi:multiple epidermal growth factor-like domains protein 10 [Gigantopelta aegis]|uniref:multiple epidermal growth factor-like domains protein 10 n=1 Tax=Gigantopelta aegis TaxID=1735272 RepID=UPI001B88A7F5|nr:multiple epidermal growth factor-like domains protein 10 [Gigantopelta aegis]XP_041357489.1 multiple epidermal growth factor-like domains protein 10 [Gigantopelta aegis]XP_041357491.1 multiple epidermal growth factor-like domains protein 10 [Gigantopelta aegis]
MTRYTTHFIFLVYALILQPGQSSGESNCPAGRYGSNCDISCRTRHCAFVYARCDAQTGDCGTEGCKPGWKGVDCKQPCIENLVYGPNCNKYCKYRHCVSTSTTCDIESGRCAIERGYRTCQAGWDGVDCAQACIQNKSYGSGCYKHCNTRHCAHPSSPCDTQTGVCDIGGCQPGWEGGDCTEGCKRGVKYGPNCNKSCTDRHCTSGSKFSCNVHDGSCFARCEPGWKGVDCKQECSFGTYGINCMFTCGQCTSAEACDILSGSCIRGCLDGFQGDLCKNVLPRKTNNTLTTVLAATTAIFILLFIISLLVNITFILRKRSKAKKSTTTGQALDAIGSSHDEHLLRLSKQTESAPP